MTDQHPITPPPELVEQWMHEASGSPPGPDARMIAAQAARWGADQELEACCEWLNRRVTTFTAAAHLEAQRRSDALRTARRPKPLSLKEQALIKLEAMERVWRQNGYKDSDIIRRALEQLND